MADLSILVTAESLKIKDTVTVPTRIYFPSAGPSPLPTLTFDAAWQETAAAVRRGIIAGNKKRGTAAATITVTSTATTPELHLAAQYVSPPLLAQTIAGTIRGQFLCLESLAAFNGNLQIGIRVVSRDGATVRATLLAVTGSTNNGATPPEFATSLTNRRYLNSSDVTPVALSSYTCVEGDRLVIEIGVRDADTSTSRTGGISFGDNTTDLPTDDTTTTLNDPWIEFDSIILFETQFESVKISELLIPQIEPFIISCGPENLKIADTVSAVLDPNPIGVPSENLKISDGPVAAQLTPLQIQSAGENLKITDGPVLPRLNPQPITVGPEALRIQDQLSAVLNPTPILIPPEAFRIREIGGSPDLYTGILIENLLLADGRPPTEENLRIADSVTAAITGGVPDLSVAIAQESLHVVDTLAAIRDLEGSPSESLKIADGPVAADENPHDLAIDQEVLHVQDTVTASRDLEASPAESLKISDSASADENPHDLSVSTESLKIADTVTAILDLIATAGPESIRISDSPITADENPRPVLVAAESLKISDSVTAAEDLVAAPSESLKIDDIGLTADENPRDLAIPSESLKITDIATTSLDPEETSAPSESLTISDTVTAFLVADLSVAVAPESLRVMDFVYGAARFIASQNTRTAGLQEDPFKLKDGPVAAILDLFVVIASESLRISESQDQFIDPEQALLSEAIKIADSVSADENPHDLSIANESLKIVDSVGASRDLEATPQESLKISESATGDENPHDLAIASENLKISDTVSAAVGLSVVVDSESLHISDGPVTGDENPRPVLVVAENLTISETLAVDTGLSVAVVENLKISDAVFVARDLETAIAPQESLSISDSVIAARGLSGSPADESLHITESISASRDLESTLTEILRVSDSVAAIQDLSAVCADESMGVRDVLGVGQLGNLDILVQPETCILSDEVSAHFTTGPIYLRGSRGREDQVDVSGAQGAARIRGQQPHVTNITGE